MAWVASFLALVTIAVVLRRVLRLNEPERRAFRGLPLLNGARGALYELVTLELEAQDAMLGVSLNEAIEERDAGNHENAWRLVQLAACEWDRLAEVLGGVLQRMYEYLPTLQLVLPVPSIASHLFKSRPMTDYARMHQLLVQLVFRAKPRFQVHLRLLRRAAETLTGEIHKAQRLLLQSKNLEGEFWLQLDLCYHDFDLVQKETLIALRSFIYCLPQAAFEEFSTDIRKLLSRGVRSKSVAAGR